MHKKYILAFLIVGILMLAISAVITAAAASSANIIGGAGWPTLMFYFRETGADWLAFIGVLAMIAAAVLLMRKK